MPCFPVACGAGVCPALLSCAHSEQQVDSIYAALPGEFNSSVLECCFGFVCFFFKKDFFNGFLLASNSK